MSKNHQVIIENTAISFLDEGSGPVVLFVHGWLDRKETFSNLIDQMKADFRCISIDLPNFGASQASVSVTTIESYAEFLRSFIHKMGLDHYVVVGHSMGGQIAIFATGNRIISPESLILLASAGVRNKARLFKESLKYTSKLLRKFVPRKIKNKLYKVVGSDYSTDLSEQHKKIISNLLQQDVQNEAKKIDTPTLLVYGDADKHTPVSMGVVLNTAIQNSKLEILPGANHWLHQSNAKNISDLIRKMNR